MIAKLKEDRTLDGFTPGKEYKYFDLYNIETAELFFHFNADDTGKHRKMNEREFTMHFNGRYSDQDNFNKF